MSKPTPARRRLKKADAATIVDALRAQGFKAEKTENRVEAWTKDRLLICGFYWQPAHGTSPACWRFDLAMSECYSLKDLKTAIGEASRVQRLRCRLSEAWKAFSSSRSDKRWMDYRGHVASLFLRHDVPKD